jgi:hypothetical protein
VHGAMLALPDVAELVREEVVRWIGASQQDGAPERVSVVAAKSGDPEEPRRYADAEAIDAHRLGVVVERVETCLRAGERSRKGWGQTRGV